MPGTPEPVVMPVAELPAAVGRRLGPSAWHLVDQDRVNGFAAATDDRQWIHVDPVRAGRTPFGGTVAHGYLTLSLAPALLDELLQIEDCRMVINYGANRIRFPAPVRVGDRVRLTAEIASVETMPDGGAQVGLALTFEAEGGDKPVCVAEIVFRYYPQAAGAVDRPARSPGSERAVALVRDAGATRSAAPRYPALGADPARVAAAWLRWLGGSYAVWAGSIESSSRGALAGDPASIVRPIGQHAELAARFWNDLAAAYGPVPRDQSRSVAQPSPRLGVELVTSHVVTALEEGVVAGCPVGFPQARVEWPSDAVVLATMRRSQDALYHELRADPDALAAASAA